MRTLFTRTVGTDGNVAYEYKEIAGTSSETKPTNVAMGSVFLEVDTGDIFVFNETAGEWVEQFSLQG